MSEPKQEVAPPANPREEELRQTRELSLTARKKRRDAAKAAAEESQESAKAEMKKSKQERSGK